VAEFGVGFRFFAKTDELAAGLRQAGEEGKQLKRTLGDTFGESSVWKNLTAVGIGTTLIRGFVLATENAQKLREEAERLGKPVDYATASVARLGDAFDQAKQFGADSATFILSGYTLIGDEVGKLINRVRGVTEAQEVYAERAAKAAEEAEKRLAKAREENNPDKIREAEKRLADARIEAAMKNADEVGKVFLLMQRELAIKEEIARVGEKSVKGLELQGQLEKTRAEIIGENRKDQEKLAKAEEQALDAEFKAIDETLAARNKLKSLKFDALSLSEQEVILAREMGDLEKEFRQSKLDGIETTDVEIALLEKANQLAKIRLEIEKKIKAEEQKPKPPPPPELNRILIGIRGGAAFNDASTATLQEILARNEAAATQAERQALGAMADPFGAVRGMNLSEAARLRTENENIRKILAQRSELETLVNAFGISGARSSFSGDPLMFESLVQRFVEDTRSTSDVQRENNRQLTDINQRLLKAGFGK
jgi:hypothetical protein